MVTLKRKVDNEKDRYGGFDEVIEVDEPKAKSYEAHKTESAETMRYSTREEFSKPKPEIMPEIKREARPQAVSKTAKKQKQALETKTKILLFAYLAVAVILAAVVIGTGIVVSNANSRVDGLELQLETQTGVLNDRETHLENLKDPIYLGGMALELDMEKIDMNTVKEMELIDIVEPVTYAESTNWFNEFCKFMSRIFGN